MRGRSHRLLAHEGRCGVPSWQPMDRRRSSPMPTSRRTGGSASTIPSPPDQGCAPPRRPCIGTMGIPLHASAPGLLPGLPGGRGKVRGPMAAGRPTALFKRTESPTRSAPSPASHAGLQRGRRRGGQGRSHGDAACPQVRGRVRSPGGRWVGGGPPPIPPSGLPGVRRGEREKVRSISLARVGGAYRRDGRAAGRQACRRLPHARFRRRAAFRGNDQPAALLAPCAIPREGDHAPPHAHPTQQNPRAWGMRNPMAAGGPAAPFGTAAAPGCPPGCPGPGGSENAAPPGPGQPPAGAASACGIVATLKITARIPISAGREARPRRHPRSPDSNAVRVFPDGSSASRPARDSAAHHL